jgi:dTDP-4-dehydrorhamnose reductase
LDFKAIFMKLMLFGKDGQVGSALLAVLPPAWDVVALGRRDADLAVAGAAADAIRRGRPDIVVNAAAWTAVDRAESEPAAARRVNAEAVAEMAGAVGDGLLIHYSSDYVFDGRKAGAYLETDPTAPLSAYGLSKQLGEVAARRAPRHLVFRTSWVHAPGHANFAATILRLAAERDSLRVVADQVGAPTAAALIAEVTLRAISMVDSGRPPPAGTYHLAAKGETSWHGYARFLVDAARASGAVLRCRADAIAAIASSDYPQPARRPLNSRLDTTRLETTLGVALPDWRDGVRDTVAAMLAEEAFA